MQKESFTTMTMRRIRLKFHAKRVIPGNWMRSMFLILVSMLASSFCFSYLVRTVDLSALMAENRTYETILNALIPQPITRNYLLLLVVSLLLYWLVISPLMVGINRFFIGVARVQKPKLSTAFSIFCDFGLILRSMGLSLWVGILKCLWALLFYALPYLLTYAATLMSSFLLLNLSMVLTVVCAVLLALKVLSYSPAPILFAEDPSIGVFGAVRNSVAITRGHLVEYLIFELSFLLYHFLVSVSGPIFSLFFQPYYRTCAVVFVDSLRKRNDPDWDPPTDSAPSVSL